MSNVYLISDTHFFHEKVIEYENRPFENVEQMNEYIIKCWNDIVKSKSDKVFFLGDFGFGNREMTRNILRRLRGNKVIILGNHDKRKSVKYWYDVGFKEVIKYPILYNNHFILSHEPLLSVPLAYINVHGHIHSKLMHDDNKYFNVSCEAINYTPINFNIIRDKHYNRRIF